ncbi:MAG: rcc01693 family protein [Roseicyclus sp.]|uniref:rcc01693 family protein n=1 Tax=Roseicyclus sp. TaxID=1914329 RepID=UPI003A83A2FE
MQGLGLHPDVFWRLSPAELALILGEGQGPVPMGRAGFEALLAQFPDVTRKDADDGRSGRGIGGAGGAARRAGGAAGGGGGDDGGLSDGIAGHVGGAVGDRPRDRRDEPDAGRGFEARL